jgi:thiol-disulfide isomerase/thioredoxin
VGRARPVLLGAVVALAAACSPEPPATDPAAEAVGVPYAAEIDVVSVDDALALVESYRGDALVVNFWATWCAPCVEEMPELARFAENHAWGGTAFLSFSVDHPDTVADRVRPFIEERKLPFAVHVIDTRNPDEIDAALGIETGGSVPATIVYGPDGQIRRAWYEQVSYDALVTAVDAAAE